MRSNCVRDNIQIFVMTKYIFKKSEMLNRPISFDATFFLRVAGRFNGNITRLLLTAHQEISL